MYRYKVNIREYVDKQRKKHRTIRISLYSYTNHGFTRITGKEVLRNVSIHSLNIYTQYSVNRNYERTIAKQHTPTYYS